MKKGGETTRPFRDDLSQIPYDYRLEVTNRLKGLDLVNKRPKEPWMEVHNIVQKAMTKTITRKRNAKRQNSCLRSKGERERYIQLNSEFQRIERRDKNAFLSDQCKEIEENNNMGKTRNLFKKIRDTKRTFHAKMGTIKGKNGHNKGQKW